MQNTQSNPFRIGLVILAAISVIPATAATPPGVWSWGYNVDGELGNGTFPPQNAFGTSVPGAVTGLTNVVAIAAGYENGLALKSDGTVWDWGLAGYLGNSSPSSSDVPVQVSGLSSVVAIAGGVIFNLAVKSDGTVWGWGSSAAGQLGCLFCPNGTVTPIQVKGISGAVAVSGGVTFSLALKNDGTVWSWGYNGYGALGQGSQIQNDVITPGQVVGLSGVVAISAGYDHSLALKSDGTVWAWGDNVYGQLGNGAVSNSGLQGSDVPVQVTSLTGMVAIAAGYDSSVALKSDGTVWTWGENALGSLGNGTTTDSDVPVQVSGLTGVTVIGAGTHTGFAVKNDGTVWAWGFNQYGELGDGTTTTRETPVLVTGLTGVTSIAGGRYSSLALVPGAGTPVSQTISFATPPVQTLGSAPLSINATASSSLPVTLVSNTSLVCTVSGSSVTLVSVGTCSLTASQSGNASYLAALPVTQTFEVAPMFFGVETSLGSGVYYLQFPDQNLFGYFNFVSSSIFYHYDMGYEAFVPGSGSDLYLYDFATMHWFYTSTTLFPYLYDFTLNTWIYYFPNTTNPGHYTANPRYFTNLTSGKIFSM